MNAGTACPKCLTIMKFYLYLTADCPDLEFWQTIWVWTEGCNVVGTTKGNLKMASKALGKNGRKKRFCEWKPCVITWVFTGDRDRAEGRSKERGWQERRGKVEWEIDKLFRSGDKTATTADMNKGDKRLEIWNSMFEASDGGTGSGKKENNTADKQ